jgi:hypothetical protein
MFRAAADIAEARGVLAFLDVGCLAVDSAWHASVGDLTSASIRFDVTTASFYRVLEDAL